MSNSKKIADDQMLNSPPPVCESAAAASLASSSKPIELKEVFDYVAHKNGKPTEAETRQIFSKFSSVEDMWSLQDLRYFLIEFLPALGYPAFVPDQVVLAAVSEVQLKGDNQTISWIDFKSFFLYLHEQPFLRLLSSLLAVLPLAELRTRSLHISNLPRDVQYEATNLLDWLAPCGPIEKLFWHQGSGQAVVILAQTDQVLGAVQLLHGGHFCAQAVSVEAYVDQRFPAIQPFKPRRYLLVDAATTVVAKGIVLVAETDEKFKISERIKDIDEEYKISEKLAQAKDSTVAAVSSIDESYKISATVKNTASNIDQEYHISERASKAKEAVLANETVQQGLSLLGSWGRAFTDSVSDLTEETVSKAKNMRETPQPGS